MSQVELLSPVPPTVAAVTARAVPPPESLAGRRIGFRMEWDNFKVFCDRLWERIEPEGEVLRSDWETSFARAGDEAVRLRARELERFAAGVDAAIVGIAA